MIRIYSAAGDMSVKVVNEISMYATYINGLYFYYWLRFRYLVVFPATTVSGSKEAMAPNQIYRPAVSDATMSLLNHAVSAPAATS